MIRGPSGLALVLALLGCGPSSSEQAIVKDPAPAPVPITTQRQVVAVVGDGEAVPLTLQFRGVGPQYQNYFSTPEFVAELATALGPCQAEEAIVLITYDSENWIGTITLETAPRTFACAATLGQGGLDMTPMQPVGMALASYRDQVSGTFDIRIASFRVGVTLLRNTNLCTFWIGGQYPPDGTTWKRCPSFAGNEHCGAGTEDEGVTVLDFAAGDDRRYAAACFGY